jgi:hypothetical protein
MDRHMVRPDLDGGCAAHASGAAGGITWSAVTTQRGCGGGSLGGRASHLIRSRAPRGRGDDSCRDNQPAWTRKPRWSSKVLGDADRAVDAVRATSRAARTAGRGQVGSAAPGASGRDRAAVLVEPGVLASGRRQVEPEPWFCSRRPMGQACRLPGMRQTRHRPHLVPRPRPCRPHPALAANAAPAPALPTDVPRPHSQRIRKRKLGQSLPRRHCPAHVKLHTH